MKNCACWEKLKTIWEKKRKCWLPAFSPFSTMFTKAVCLRFIKSQDCIEKGLPFPKQALVFTCLQYKSFENSVGKGEIACNEQFLLFPLCFLSIWKTFCHFHQP